MRIGILGTRGIPNHHGGFEQFAEYFATYAVQQGCEVYVYNSNLHPYQQSEYKGVKIIKVKDLEDKIGTPGQFIYDWNAIIDARKRNFDVLLQLGYTSNSVWKMFLPKKAVIVTNMDGLEWKRTKYNKYVKQFLKLAEKWAVDSSDYLISDSLGIQTYLNNKYKKDSKYIAYGADTKLIADENHLADYQLTPYAYNMLIARIEPENNIETILDGHQASQQNYPFLVIGDAQKTPFGRYLLDKFKNTKTIKFLGAIYNQEVLNSLRFYANLYFHGHSVGGTNPSLLEAMSSKACIVAHDNTFNRSILQENAYYFKDSLGVQDIIDSLTRNDKFIQANYQRILKDFQWETINQQYLDFLKECLHAGKTKK